MKKGIILIANGGTLWIGGLYYIKNIAFQMLNNKNIINNYTIHIITTLENKHVFSQYEDQLIIRIKQWINPITKCLDLLLYSVINNIAFIYPFLNSNELAFKIFSLIGVRLVYWIPDFQHCHLPDMFSKSEISKRDNRFKKISKSSVPLILSSKDSLNDLKTYFSRDTAQNVFVVPFVSNIEYELRQIEELNIEQIVLKKYGLSKSKYICISNQFWKHKNHLVVLDAIKGIQSKKNDFDMLFVFTGQLEEWRDPEYINEVKNMFNDVDIKPLIKILGFIQRLDQIVIMKNAKFIIQPSLFEGWGTVVEDAKVMDKMILISNIPVHREQMDENCVLFDPMNSRDLTKKIIVMSQREHKENIEKGIVNMYVRGTEYSCELAKLFGVGVGLLS
jgi:glycosyltransferase involved in cell wall biosynthesis